GPGGGAGERRGRRARLLPGPWRLGGIGRDRGHGAARPPAARRRHVDLRGGGRGGGRRQRVPARVAGGEAGSVRGRPRQGDRGRVTVVEGDGTLGAPVLREPDAA